MAATYAELALDNARLRSKLAELQSTLQTTITPPHATSPTHSAGRSNGAVASNSLSAHLPPPSCSSSSPPHWSSSLRAVTSLSRSDALRYSRHLLCGELGARPVLVQLALQRCAVLVVGAGGLGCPVLQQLAAAGVGRLGVVDPDIVDLSNLPRQSLYDDRHVGRAKAQAAAERLRQINPSCAVTAHSSSFSHANCMALASCCQLLVDCSDNVATRYLCSDVSVALGIPCVSGAALRLEGQLTVYGWRNGPCMRCIHPNPPPAAALTNCNEGGVLNAVTACIGALQALEAIKIIAHSATQQHTATLHTEGEKEEEEGASTAAESVEVTSLADSSPFCDLEVLSGRLLCFDAASSSGFRVVRLRGRSPTCSACSAHAQPRLRAAMQQGLVPSSLGDPSLPSQCNMQQYGSLACQLNDDAPVFDLSQSPLPASWCVSPSALASAYLAPPASASPFLVLDVRPPLQFDIAHLPHSISMPLAQMPHAALELAQLLRGLAQQATTRWAQQRPSSSPSLAPPLPSLFVLCRRGVDSVQAVSAIRAAGATGDAKIDAAVLNVEGGLIAWTEQVDPTFPLY